MEGIDSGGRGPENAVPVSSGEMRPVRMKIGLLGLFDVLYPQLPGRFPEYLQVFAIAKAIWQDRGTFIICVRFGSRYLFFELTLAVAVELRSVFIFAMLLVNGFIPFIMNSPCRPNESLAQHGKHQ